ncbi:MAG: ABC transporter ATP-binding protein [Aerococcus sp.]|nr:ABC transporter ATP-binding protein [Aerococcus sp.]
MTIPWITVEDLTIEEKQASGKTRVLVDHVSFTIEQGEVLGLIGESGSGKSLTMKALMGLLPKNLTVTMKTFTVDGQPVSDPTKLPFTMIFQDPMTSLDPVFTIGEHLEEVIARFQAQDPIKINQQAIAMLDHVGIPNPEKVLTQYPHELSGGMQQRVMIGMALLTHSKLLIADEPTTALDVTIQKQILQLMRQLQMEQALTLVIVSHDFGVIAGMSDRVDVMYQGRIIEENTTDQLFNHPQHAYTKQLLQSAELSNRSEEGHHDNKHTVH